jgi:hypothetical protein
VPGRFGSVIGSKGNCCTSVRTRGEGGAKGGANKGANEGQTWG